MNDSDTPLSLSLPDFDDLCSQLVPLGALNSPAELHGLLCGRLSGGARLDDRQWLALVAKYMDLATEMPADTCDTVVRMYHTTLAQLNDDSFGLQLQLPDDDTELPLRADALGQWCQGFLNGFGSSGIEGDSNLPAEVADALRDLAAISQIDVEDNDNADESEANFEQVAEYVRMAVLNIFLEYGITPGAPSQPDNNTLH